jgi:protein-L-isoaspartate(D-aspartate) O-methyltransferase
MRGRGDRPPRADEARKRLTAQLRAEVLDERVLHALATVPREAFVPAELAGAAYDNIPLAIGYGQTISQPLIVALMTAALDPRPTDTILEVGTGSGYQAAILAELAGRVVTVERVPALTYTAQAVLDSLGYQERVTVRLAGEVLGCPEEAPFDCILVTAGAPRVPDELVRQLAPGGRMVIPVGGQHQQDLLRVERKGPNYTTRMLGKCRFVPLIGRSAWDLSPSES